MTGTSKLRTGYFSSATLSIMQVFHRPLKTSPQQGRSEREPEAYGSEYVEA